MNNDIHAKYSYVYGVNDEDPQPSPVKKRSISKVLLRIFTGFAFLFWLVVVGYFLVYPLLPKLQDMKVLANDFNLYSISYNMTTQLFVTLSPPDYELSAVKTPVRRENYEKSMEYIDPDEVEIADLEEKNTLVTIEAINVHGHVVDGLSQEAMLDGFWHYPSSSVPGERGNTVIFGHRFHRIPPHTETFFNLDKVSVGDRVSVEQTGKEIEYTVVKKMVVDKNDGEILESTGDFRLTLITCTPLWTSEKRLVVIAVQDRLSSVI